MIKQITILMLALLLVAPMMSAGQLDLKQTEKQLQLNFKNIDYKVKETGIYNDKNEQIKTKEQAEIWIDKKVGDTYHVDSLVQDDTTIELELFFNIQPDEINYRSHNGKYKGTLIYGDWVWVDKVDCINGSYCGGYATFETTLEYGLGSNTFTSAISGATWMNDGVDVTLTEDTDYTLNGTTFTISNINYAWNNLSLSWSYLADTDKQIMIDNLNTNFTKGIDNVSSKIPTVLIIAGIVLILGILVLLLIVWGNLKLGNEI